MSSGNNLKQIGIAVHSAHDGMGAYPPVCVNQWSSFYEPNANDYTGPYLPHNQASSGGDKTSFFNCLLPYIEQDNLFKDAPGFYMMGQRRSNANEIIGGSTPKTYVSPLDSSPYPKVDWSWPYTGSGSSQIFKMGLVSYAPNIRAFGRVSKQGGWESWKVMWWHTGAGQSKVANIADGLSNTVFVAEKNMVTGAGTMKYKDWGISGGSGAGAGAGIQMWATTDTPEIGLPVFGITCDDPSQGWDDEYGQWWRKDCRFATGQPEYFQPPRRRLAPAQQSIYTIYAMSSGGTQVLMGDGSVRNITTSISVPTWSAAITPDGGEINTLN